MYRDFGEVSREAGSYSLMINRLINKKNYSVSLEPDVNRLRYLGEGIRRLCEGCVNIDSVESLPDILNS